MAVVVEWINANFVVDKTNEKTKITIKNKSNVITENNTVGIESTKGDSFHSFSGKPCITLPTLTPPP